MTVSWILMLHAVSTWYMVGLIWMVQVVHYNLFDRVGRDAFADYETDHGRLITPIVGLPMLIEIATAAWFAWRPPAGIPTSWMVAGLVMVVLIWASTALLQVPCHAQLSNGFDQSVYERLVTTNWIRTVLWSARGILVSAVLLKLLEKH